MLHPPVSDRTVGTPTCWDSVFPLSTWRWLPCPDGAAQSGPTQESLGRLIQTNHVLPANPSSPSFSGPLYREQISCSPCPQGKGEGSEH